MGFLQATGLSLNLSVLHSRMSNLAWPLFSSLLFGFTVYVSLFLQKKKKKKVGGADIFLLVLLNTLLPSYFWNMQGHFTTLHLADPYELTQIWPKSHFNTETFLGK